MMAVTSISLVGLLIVLLVIGLPLLVGMGFAFAAIRRRNWGGLAVIALGLSGVLGFFLFASLLTVRGVRAQEQVQVAYALERAHQVAMQSPPAAPPAPTVVKAEVVSNEELAAIASAQPKIKLEEISVPVEAAADGATDDSDPLADARSDRPDWIDAHLGDNQKLITSGPFTTKDSCQSDTQKQLTEWVWSRHRNQWPSGAGPFPDLWIDGSQVVKSQHEEIRDTSVGEVHLLYTLAEATPEVDARMSKMLADAAAEVGRTRGVRAVSFAGAGVLSLVALTHVVLKSGGRKAKNGAP